MRNIVATKDSDLREIPKCSLYIPQAGTIKFYAMPSISDSKGARYDPAPVIGRSSPILTYSSSEIRQINLEIPFIARKRGDFYYNAMYLRWIQSATYPREGENGCPYKPPVVCVLTFGGFLWKSGSICVLLDKYDVKNDPSVPSDPETLVPVKFSVNTSWQVAYASRDLPNQSMIINLGK